MKRRSILVVTVAAATLAIAVPAWAFWTVGSSDASGVVAAAALGTPRDITTPHVGARRVTISIGRAPSRGPTPDGYQVERISPGAVTGVCAIAGRTGRCEDTAPVPGQLNRYRVYARLRGTHWRSLLPGSVDVLVASVADHRAPEAPSILVPAGHHPYDASSWPGAISGTASDDPGGSGVRRTAVAIRSVSSGKYWNGSTFDGTAVTWLAATSVGPGNTTWSYDFQPPANGSFVVQARTTDKAGNVGPSSSLVFSVDLAPVATDAPATKTP